MKWNIVGWFLELWGRLFKSNIIQRLIYTYSISIEVDSGKITNERRRCKLDIH